MAVKPSAYYTLGKRRARVLKPFHYGVGIEIQSATAECYIECVLRENALETNILNRSPTSCVLHLRNPSTVCITFIKIYVTLGSDMHNKHVR